MTMAQTIDLSLSASGWESGGNTGQTQTGNYMSSGVGVQSATGTQTISCCGPNTWTIGPYTGSTMLGMQPGSTANYSAMTGALGLSSASISALNTEVASQGGSITSSSWISKNFTFAADTKFKMAWVYTSTDYVPFNDGSLTSLVNTDTATTLAKINGVSAQYILLGATNPGTGNYSTGSYGSTGWQWVNYDVTTAGTYKLGFAIFNQGDTALSPVLFVNDGLGTVANNGTAFNPVAPNNPNMPTTNPDGTVTDGGTTPPSAPTVVSTAPGTSLVTSTSTPGSAVLTSAIAYGTTDVAVAKDNSKGAVTPKTLTVVQKTTVTNTTPFTITNTTTTPVTTVTTTTPTVVKTWSDGTTTTENGTPTQATTVANNVSTATVTGTEIAEAQTNKNYSTRVDQVSYLENANQRINQQLNSDVFDRQEASDNTVKPRSTLYGSEEKGWVYMNIDGQRSNTNDGYSMNGQRFTVGYEKNIENNHLVGVQFNNYSGSLSGNNANGSMDKQHVGLYSLYAMDDWIFKSDLGYAYNNFKNNHSIPELQLSNTGSTSGQDLWLSSRVYAPATEGIRPYVGARVENNSRNGFTESGSTVSAMNYAGINTTKTSAEAGVRFDKVIFDDINFIAEAGTTTQNLTSYKAGVNYSPGKNVIGGVTIGQQQQNGVTNTTAQASVRIFF
jgi:hypothetical protein